MSNGTVLITGGTGAIGAALCAGFHDRGYTVVANCHPADVERSEAALAALRTEHGIHAELVPFDVTDHDAARTAIDGFEDDTGAIDILVNNAGMQHVAPVEDFPPDQWDKIIALNLTAAFHTTRHAVPAMKEKGWGRIINTASAHSLTASPFKSAYNASKHGIAGFTKTIALELAQTGVTANCISPGYVWTPLIEGQIPDTMKARGLSREEVINDVLLAKQPTKKFVQPAEVGALAVFLCREEAGNVTGANWSIDGGWTAE